MATVRAEITVNAAIEDVWDAVRDFGRLHERLAPGFVTDCVVDGEDRVVTFFNGTVVRERLISVSEADHRLAWTIVDGPWTHHSGSVELHPEGVGRTRFVWTTDVLPHGTADATRKMVGRGCWSSRDARRCIARRRGHVSADANRGPGRCGVRDETMPA